MDTNIIITYERRPCLVEIIGRRSRGEVSAKETRRGLFHGFVTVAEVAAPSIARGSHNGGQLSDVFALVEFSDGTVRKVDPERLQFLDSAAEFDCYAWPEEATP